MGTECIFYVPVTNYEAYLTANEWSKFSDRIFPDYGNDYEHGTILFDSAGGTEVDAIEAHELNAVFQTNAVTTKAGYSFDGWYLNPSDESSRFVVGETIISKSVKLYAKWSLADLKITFDYNGGQGDTEYSFVTYTHRIGSLPVAKRVGYNFDGWYYGSQRIDEDTVAEFSTDITLKASWVANSYEVTFDYQGGTETLEKKSVVFDSPYGDLPTSQKEGYKLTGWYYEDLLIDKNTIVKVPSGHQLTAHWGPIAYSIKFDPNGGEIETDFVECLFGEEYDVPKASRRGYTFLYWEGINSEKFYFGDKFTNLSVKENSVVSLKAVYEKDIYVISYNLDGGLNNPDNPQNYSVDSGEIVLGNPTRVGYVFVAWYSNPEKTNLIESIPTGSVGDIDIYAKWEANINTLHFDANGGDGSMDDVRIATDVTYYLPKNKFTKKGYEFIGWKTLPDEDIGASFADEATYVMGVEPEYTLYAVWGKRVYEIQYQTNGGVNDTTNPISYTIDSPTLELKAATRDGYTFVSWCNDISLTQEIAVIQSGNTGNITLYAKWSANENTLHFNANGGDGSMEDQKIKTGETAQLRQNLFSKSGSRFAGWGYAPSGSSVYEEKAAYTMGPQSDYTLYAIWTQTAYTIQYNLNGGTNSTANPSGYNSEGGVIVLAEPSKTGNTFGGWYKSSSFTSDSRITQINTGDTGNLVLYAKWIKNQYKVTFNYNGGSGSPSSKDVTYSETYGALPSANRTGYTFNGWYYNNNRIYDSTEVIVAGAHTLEARWSINSYIIYINENHVDVKVIRNDTNTEVQTGDSIPYNTSLTISFTTNSGYHDGWCDYSGQTINMPANNLTINSGATQDSNCVTRGTLVKTSDSRDIPSEKLNVGDLIVSWDYRTKSWIATPITLLVYHGDSMTDIVTLEFSNGRSIKVVDSHEFYDVSKQTYVLIGLYNFSEFIGDAFVCYNANDGSLDTVRLVNAYKSQEYTGSYTIVSSGFYNCITNDIVSATPNIPGIYELISAYLDADLNFDSQALQRDIEEYGLYDYELFAECLSYEQYSGLCAAYFKIAAGKGFTSFEEIYYLMMMFSYVYK